MEIGEPQRIYTIEPVEEPVPREHPEEPEVEREPAPLEPEVVPRP